MVNGQEMPVPIPVTSLTEAMNWFESNMLPEDKAVTCLYLDGEDITEIYQSHSLKSQALTPQSKLEVLVESPVELTIGCLEAMDGTAKMLIGESKRLCVQLWQLDPLAAPTEVVRFEEDLRLLLDLAYHMLEFVDRTGASIAGVIANSRLLTRNLQELEDAHRQKNFQLCARIILNKIRPWLKEQSTEVEKVLMSLRS